MGVIRTCSSRYSAGTLKREFISKESRAFDNKMKWHGAEVVGWSVLLQSADKGLHF